MKVHLSAQVGSITVTLVEGVFWEGMILNPNESEMDRRLLGERPNIAEVTREAAIGQIAERLVTIHLYTPFTAEQIRAHAWLVEPMGLQLLIRAELIAHTLTNSVHPIHPDSRASMSRAAAECVRLNKALLPCLETIP